MLEKDFTERFIKNFEKGDFTLQTGKRLSDIKESSLREILEHMYDLKNPPKRTCGILINSSVHSGKPMFILSANELTKLTNADPNNPPKINESREFLPISLNG